LDPEREANPARTMNLDPDWNENADRDEIL
jgi:hypothetical protein